MIVEELSFQLNYSKTPFNIRCFNSFIPKKIKEDKILSTVVNSLYATQQTNLDQIFIYPLSTFYQQKNLVLFKNFDQIILQGDLKNLLRTLSEIKSRTLFICFGKTEGIDPSVTADVNAMYASLCPQTLKQFYLKIESLKKNTDFFPKEGNIIYQEDYGKAGMLSSAFSEKKLNKILNQATGYHDIPLDGWSLFSCIIGEPQDTAEVVHIDALHFNCIDSSTSISRLRSCVKEIYRKLYESPHITTKSLPIKIVTPSYPLASLVLKELEINEAHFERSLPDFFRGWSPHHTFFETISSEESNTHLMIDFSRFPLGSAYRIHKEIKSETNKH